MTLVGQSTKTHFQAILPNKPEAIPKVRMAIPENRGIQKMEIQFFSIIACQPVLAKMSKLVHKAASLTEKKQNFFFFLNSLFSGIAGENSLEGGHITNLLG